MKVKSLSRVRLLATPWTTAYQAPPSMGFSRQEYWSGVPLPSLSALIRRPKETFLQRRHTDGQEAHEKMLGIIKYYANQNYNEIPLHTNQNGHRYRSTNNKC